MSKKLHAIYIALLVWALIEWVAGERLFDIGLEQSSYIVTIAVIQLFYTQAIQGARIDRRENVSSRENT